MRADPGGNSAQQAPPSLWGDHDLHHVEQVGVHAVLCVHAFALMRSVCARMCDPQTCSLQRHAGMMHRVLWTWLAWSCRIHI